MVTTNGITSATKRGGKRRHRGFSVSFTSFTSFTSSTTSATSVFQESADTHLFIDRCSLLIDLGNGTTQTETANAQNQITSISGSVAAVVTIVGVFGTMPRRAFRPLDYLPIPQRGRAGQGRVGLGGWKKPSKVFPCIYTQHGLW